MEEEDLKEQEEEEEDYKEVLSSQYLEMAILKIF